MSDEFPDNPYEWQHPRGQWPVPRGPGANLPRRPPYSMSPSRPLPFPTSRTSGPQSDPPRYGPLHPSSWQRAPPDLSKCDKSKTKKSYRKCAAAIASKAASANWDKCARVGKSIQKQKGIAKKTKKALKRAQVAKCLRGGR